MRLFLRRFPALAGLLLFVLLRGPGQLQIFSRWHHLLACYHHGR